MKKTLISTLRKKSAKILLNVGIFPNSRIEEEEEEVQNGLQNCLGSNMT